MTKRKKIKIEKLISSFDPLGSYTGNFVSATYEEPVQDVDDL